MIDFKTLKQGDIIHLKGIFGVSCIGIFNKILNNTIILYCVTFDDLKEYVAFKTDDKKYCFFNIDAIKYCELATEDEINKFYSKMVNYYTECVDTAWDMYFTDSVYYEIKDWISHKCNLDYVDTPKFVYELTDYIWKYMCNLLNCEDEDNISDDKMVSLNDVCKWLEEHGYDSDICSDEDSYDIYKLINQLRKAMVE